MRGRERATLTGIVALLAWPAAAAEARFPPDKREEANRIQFEIARCLQSHR